MVTAPRFEEVKASMSDDTQAAPDSDKGPFHTLVEDVAKHLGGEVTEGADGTSLLVKTTLKSGRTQMVLLQLDGDSIRFSTRCSSFRPELDNARFLKLLLCKNYRLKHGYFALNPDGGVEIVASQLFSTCDAEELAVALTNLANLGDFMEQELGQGDGDNF